MTVTVTGASGAGCNNAWHDLGGNQYVTISNITGTSVTVGWDNTACTYTANSATILIATPSQGFSSMVDIGGVPWIAYMERETGRPQNQRLYVKSWTGSAWTIAGTGQLNRNSESGNINNGPWSQIPSLSIASDGTNPWVAWEEYTTANCSNPSCYSHSVPQIYVSHWTGSAWATNGSGLNVSTTLGWASEPSITYLSGQPYVCWTERATSISGTSIADGVAKLYCKTTSNGTTWTLVGSGALNRDQDTGWAWKPSLATDGTNVFVGWAEQQNLGQKTQTYVSKWNGSVWSVVGGSLNADTSGLIGSAQNLALTVMSGNPVAAFGEVNYGATRQIYAKTYNGSAWVSLGSGIPGVGGTLFGGKILTGGRVIK